MSSSSKNHHPDMAEQDLDRAASSSSLPLVAPSVALRFSGLPSSARWVPRGSEARTAGPRKEDRSIHGGVL